MTKGSNRADQILNKINYYSWVELGSSFLMTELHAAYIYHQIKKYERILEKRKKIYINYLKNLSIENKINIINSKKVYI